MQIIGKGARAVDNRNIVSDRLPQDGLEASSDVSVFMRRPPLKIGDLLLGRYRILGELGQGGMGQVFRCRDDVGGIEVAIKTLPPDVARDSAEMEEVRENFAIVEKLHHPNIAALKTLEADPATGAYYLVMELAHGVNLRQWRKTQGQPSQETTSPGRSRKVGLPDILPIIRQIALALDFAHENKVIHRDVKPSNVMVDAEGRVKVLDFGLAAQIYTSLSRMSRVRFGTSGTGPYMAPEQWEGQYQNAATDQYALAVLSFELLVGRCPFEGHEFGVLRESVLKSVPAYPPDMPPGIQAVLKRGLAKRREDRFATCRDFVAALEDATAVSASSRFARKAGAKWIVAAIAACALAIGGVSVVSRFQPVASGSRTIPNETPRPVPEALQTIPAVESAPTQTETPRTSDALRAPEEKVAPAAGATKLVREEKAAAQTEETPEKAMVPTPGRDWVSPATGMEFVWVEPMGIWVGKYEVTNEDYLRFSPDHDSGNANGIGLNDPRQPVAWVNHDDATAFIAWLNHQDKTALSDANYRLPTESEWIRFAQCGDDRPYPWGHSLPPTIGNYADETAARALGISEVISGYDDGCAATCPVEQSGQNDWGLHGVGGNVWEMTTKDGNPALHKAWFGASCMISSPELLKCDSRDVGNASLRYTSYGFRLVMSRP